MTVPENPEARCGHGYRHRDGFHLVSGSRCDSPPASPPVPEPALTPHVGYPQVPLGEPRMPLDRLFKTAALAADRMDGTVWVELSAGECSLLGVLWHDARERATAAPVPETPRAEEARATCSHAGETWLGMEMLSVPGNWWRCGSCGQAFDSDAALAETAATRRGLHAFYVANDACFRCGKTRAFIDNVADTHLAPCVPQQEEVMPKEGKFTAAQVSALVREALAEHLAEHVATVEYLTAQIARLEDATSDAEKQIASVLDLCDRSDEVNQSLPPNARKVYVLNVRLALNSRHRYPCLNGSVCGEPSNCPPADD